MAWLSAISTLFFLAAYPIAYVAPFAYAVLRLLGLFLISLARYPLRLALFPVRVLAHFEAILIFITAAGCIGFVLGIVLYLSTHYTVELLNQWVGFVVSNSPLRLEYEALAPPVGTVAKRSVTPDLFKDARLKWAAKKYAGPRDVGGPSASTILEEDDESSSAYFED